MMSGMTVGLLKEILIKHNVSDDDVINFCFTFTSAKHLRGQKYLHTESREMEFDQLYKREFGILMDFIPTKLEES